MSDIFEKQKRSDIMSAVRSDNNKSTELKLIDIFKNLGIKGWRRSYKVKGKPDFVFLKEKIAMFTDGCFWHGHSCRNISPKDNSEYWRKKITANKMRDVIVGNHLRSLGWKVVRIWECELIKKNCHIAIAKMKDVLVVVDKK